MKKGDFYITSDSKTVYKIVGRWGYEIVIADTDEASEEVLVYLPSEIEEMIVTGKLRKLHKTGIKIDKEPK